MLGQAAQAAPSDDLCTRLLCAANDAYGIGFVKSGTFTPRSPFHEKAGFTDAAPTIIVSGANNIDACMIATMQGPSSNPAQRDIVLAFRGTFPPTDISSMHDLPALMRDWGNDFLAEPVDFTTGSSVIAPGKVHKGFRDSLKSLFDQGLAQRVQERLTSGVRLYVTGHSKGGALAYLGALRLFRMHQIKPAGVVTFASPRPGDGAFVNSYASAGINSLRWEFQDDMVPNLPPSNIRINQLISALATPSAITSRILAALNITIPATEMSRQIVNSLRALKTVEFESAGSLRFIHWDSTIRTDSPELQAERNIRTAVLLLWPKYWVEAVTKIPQAHMAGCGSGYMSKIGPGVC